MVNWKYKLNLKEDWQKAERKEITAKELADIIIDKIINSAFSSKLDDDFELQDIINELNGMGADDSFDDFDVIWDQFYDWADENKVWVVII